MKVLTRIPSYEKARTKIRKWFDPSVLIPEKVRGALMGLILNVTLADICIYKMIQQDVRAGEMPRYLIGTLIVVAGTMEVVLAPLVSWWGYRRRRTMLILWSALIIATLFTWYLIPSNNARPESEFCDLENKANNLNFTGVTWTSAIRMAIFLVSGLVFLIARVGVWCHGLAYLEEYAPEQVTSHYGVLLIARVMPFLIGSNVVMMIEKNISLQTTFFLLGMFVNLLQLYLNIPKDAPEVNGVQKALPPMETRSLTESVSRVLSNILVASQIVTMGFLAGSLWGYAFFNADVIKVKFNIASEHRPSMTLSTIVQYAFVILILAFAGLHFSFPILVKFCNLKAMKQATLMNILALITYVLLMTVPSCDKGVIAGMNGHFESPECSLKCGCKATFNEFSPVCVVDEMTTYLSPCQAGCTGTENINAVTMYVNCTCGAGPATPGACTDATCNYAYDLHQTFFLLLVTFILLALQVQGSLLLKIVDVRDISVVSGVGWAMMALIVYVCSSTYFGFIASGSCSWMDGDVCHLHNDAFPTLLGTSCIVLVVIAVIINMTAYICMRRQNKRHRETSI